jgi:hypothetical protein
MSAERGQRQVRQPARDGPKHGHAAPGQASHPAHDDRGDHGDQQARDPAVDPAGSQHDHDDPGRHRHICPVYLRQRAHHLQELGRGALAGDSHPEHVRELPGGDPDTDAGKEPDQHGPGQEIRQEPEPGQPGQQQQPAREQGRQPGQGRAEDGRCGRIRADDEMAR